MEDRDQQDRLAELKDAERRRSAKQSTRQSARQSAMQRLLWLLSQDDSNIEDKIAAVKAVQRADKARVTSAITSLMRRDGRAPDCAPD